MLRDRSTSAGFVDSISVQWKQLHVDVLDNYKRWSDTAHMHRRRVVLPARLPRHLFLEARKEEEEKQQKEALAAAEAEEAWQEEEEEEEEEIAISKEKARAKAAALKRKEKEAQLICSRCGYLGILG